MTDDSLITLKAAHRLLHEEYGLEISRDSLKRWAIAGARGKRLEHIIVGGRYFTRRSWLLAFIEDGHSYSATTERGLQPDDLRRSEEAKQELIRLGVYRPITGPTTRGRRPSNDPA